MAEKDSVEVTVGATADIINAGGSFFLVGKAREVICYAAVVSFARNNNVKKAIAKSLFPSGITHFILMTTQGQPLNERLVFIDHHDSLTINIDPNPRISAVKDSVALHIKVTDNTGQPVTGNFSLALTDDAQVNTDSLNNDNILTRLLLTSDLKGYVEEPGYYFRGNNTAKQALDNLLLTQGWVNYEPVATQIAYQPESSFIVKGRVTNVFGSVLKKQHVILLSVSPAMVIDTITDKGGRFIFDRLPRADTPVFFLKTVNRNFNVNIDVDEVTPPVFKAPVEPLAAPWYVNTDTTLMNYMRNNTQMQQQEYFPGSGRRLKEVTIISKKTVKGSENLNGPGNADIVLDEKQLENSGKKSWRKLFEENIPGFREVTFYDLKRQVVYWEFYVYSRPAVLMVDGVMVSKLLQHSGVQDYKQFIEEHDAEDIKGLEVLLSTKYTANYLRIFFPMAPLDSCVFIEVTTRGGNPLIKNTPGTYLLKPLAVTWPTKYYKPRYAVRDTSHTIDLRSTLDWEPNIVTNKNGEAIVSFYTGSAASTYSVTMEGIDDNGMLGYKREKILTVKHGQRANQ